MSESLDILSYAQQIALRAAIIRAERRLEKMRYHRRKPTQDERKSTLVIRALNLGRDHRDVANPFTGWNHEFADELAKSYQAGQGRSSQ